jgi:hypothetical protein
LWQCGTGKTQIATDTLEKSLGPRYSHQAHMLKDVAREGCILWKYCRVCLVFVWVSIGVCVVCLIKLNGKILK